MKSLTPGRCGGKFGSVISEHIYGLSSILLVKLLLAECHKTQALEIAVRWICGPRSMSPYAINKPQFSRPIEYHVFIWTNADLLSVELLGTNYNDIWFELQQFLFTKMHLHKRRLKCLCLNMFNSSPPSIDLARNSNSGCANEILGCAKCHFLWKSPWKWKN